MKPVEFIGDDGKVYMRQPCEIFSRCMGYIRPVSHYNDGKKSEFYSRKYFKEDNQNFISSFS